MLAHREIMMRMARAICDSTIVRDYAIARFSRGLQIYLGAYADEIPGEEASPFLWIYSDGESECVNTDERFDVSLVVGACPLNSDGERVISEVIKARTVSENGIISNGAIEAVEGLRDIILSVIRGAKCGARVISFSRVDNGIAHQPLDWSACTVTMQLDSALDDDL